MVGLPMPHRRAGGLSRRYSGLHQEPRTASHLEKTRVPDSAAVDEAAECLCRGPLLAEGWLISTIRPSDPAEKIGSCFDGIRFLFGSYFRRHEQDEKRPQRGRDRMYNPVLS